jgi:DNA repair ATPase RecN
LKQATADWESDYHKFLFNELEEAGLKENEFEEAEQLLKRQTHSEAIKTVLTGIHYSLELSDQPPGSTTSDIRSATGTIPRLS